MRTLRLISPLILLLTLFFTSCEKKEQPITLPARNGSAHATVVMGEDYTDQVFYNLASGNIVYTSKVKSWDLAFESTPTGYHVFLNGALWVFAYNTHKTDMKDVDGKLVAGIKDNEWLADAACGLNDSTAIGDWVDGSNRSKKEVYVLKNNAANIPDTFRKLQLLSVTDHDYTFSYSDLQHPYGKTIIIPKDPNYNYVFYSLIDERISTPEPQKNTWDIVFTSYRAIYHEYENMPYKVSGVLLNPNNTTAAMDSTTPYQNANAEIVSKLKFTDFRDVIGFRWKTFVLNQGYTVNSEKVYVIKNQYNQFFKFHFLGFYDNKGIKGSPSFEYEQLK